MLVSDPKYQIHKVFAELDEYVEFYRNLAFSVCGWASTGTGAPGNIDTYVLSSMQGTLTSIRMILRDGRINDAYALLRKYYDSAIINVYSNLYLEEHVSLDKLIVEEIDNWRKGKAQLPEFRQMAQYIRASTRVAPITERLQSDPRYKHLRDRCNDHTHYNFYRNVLLNDHEIHLPERGAALDNFSEDLRDLFVLHFAYLFFAKQHYMMSSDYVDSLECGMVPDEDSLYWVAPFIQDAFDQIVAKHRPDVAETLERHTTMHLNATSPPKQ